MATNLRRLDATDRGYRLMQDLIESVEFRLRVPTAWNGAVYVASSPTLLARAGRSWNGEPPPLHDWDAVRANPNHSITVRGDLLDHALKAQSGGLDVRDNFKAHQAVLRMVHTAAALSRHDLVDDPPPSHREDAASDVLTLGLSQDWALKNTNLVIADIDLNTRAPRLTASRVVDLVPHATTAARGFVAELATSARRPRDATHRELVSTHPAQRWNQVADWLIDSNLSGLIRPDQRAELRAELAGIAHDRYAKVADIPDRLADMPTRTSPQRVELISTYKNRGERDGKTTVERLNIHIKGKQVGWGEQAAGDDRVRRAAEELGVPIGKLQEFLHSSSTTGNASRDDAGTPQEGPADSHHRGTGRRADGPAASR